MVGFWPPADPSQPARINKSTILFFLKPSLRGLRTSIKYSHFNIKTLIIQNKTTLINKIAVRKENDSQQKQPAENKSYGEDYSEDTPEPKNGSGRNKQTKIM